MNIALRGGELRYEADVHKALREQLGFGPYYGNNLAALRDRLSTDTERPVHLIWYNAAVSRFQLGADLFERLVEIFRSIEQEDVSFGWVDRFTFELRE